MPFLQRTSTRLHTRLIGYIGVGSLLLIFIAGQISDYASNAARDEELRAIAVIDAISEARFEISQLSVTTALYLDSHDLRQLNETQALRARVDDHLRQVLMHQAELRRTISYFDIFNEPSDYEFKELLDYDVAFAQAQEYEKVLGTPSAPGLRDAFTAAAEPFADILLSTDPAVVRASLAVLREADRISTPGADLDTTSLISKIDAAGAAVSQSSTFTVQQKQRFLPALEKYSAIAGEFISVAQKQMVARAKLRALSQSASANFADIATRINSSLRGMRTQAASAQTLIRWLNLGFSAFVGFTFIFLANTIGRRMRAQANTILTNETRFRQLVEAMADFAVETDTSYNIQHYFVRPSFAPSVDPLRLLGRRLFESNSDDSHFIYYDKEAFNRFLETRTAFRDFEYKITTANGYIGWRKCYGTPYYNDRGEFAGFRILTLDTTAEKESERLRQEADAAYRAVATAAFGAFYRIDTHGRILSLEGVRSQPPAIMNMQRTGRYIWDAMADLGIRYPADINLKSIIANGIPFSDVEIQTLNADNTTRGWFVHRGVPIRDRNGISTGYVIAVANISKQKILEKEAVAKAQELERIIETMPGVFYRLSGRSVETATIEYMSPRIVDIIGYKPEEIINRPGFNLTKAGDHESSYFEDGIGNRPPASQEKRLHLRRKDGSYATVIEKPVEIAIKPDGSKIIEGLLIDISDLAQRDAEIASRRRQMEAIVDNLPGWIYGFEIKDGEVLDSICSGSSIAVIGYTGEQLIELFNRGSVSYAHPDDLYTLQKTWSDVMVCNAGSGSFENRYRVKHRDGHWVWVSDRGRYTRSADGVIHLDGIVLDITAETMAQGETEIVASAVNAASDMVCVIDPKGMILYANSAFAALVEFESDISMRGVDIATTGRFISPDDLAVRRAINAALKQSGRYRGEVGWESNGGRRRRMDLTVTRTATKHDVLIARDVTEASAAAERRNRLNAAAARVGIARGSYLMDFHSGIQELTEIAAKALDVAQVGVWLFEGDQREAYRAIDIFDHRTGRHADNIVHTRAQYPMYFAALDLMRNIVASDAANDPATREFKDSYLIPFGISGMLDTPIFRAGKVMGVLCIERSGPVRPWLDEEVAFATVIADSIAFGIEAEERKVAQRQVANINIQLNRVVKALDSSQDNIIIEDSDGRIAYMNARALQSSAPVVNGSITPPNKDMTFGDLFPNFHARRIAAEQKILQDLSEHGSWEDEIEITHPNGRVVYMEVRIARLPDGGQICVATDITARRRQAERENGLRSQLAEAQKMEAIGRLAGGIAHDFNNIIAAVAAYASVISGDSCSNTQHTSYANKIRTICGRASDIVKQILLFAKAKTAAHEPVMVGDIVTEAQELLTASLPASVDVKVINNAGGAVVLGANAQLLQVLLNLGLNSGDAIREDQGYIEIALDRIIATSDDADGTDKIIMRKEDGATLSRSLKGTLVAGTSYVRISVRDNGPGIPNDVLERIYEPFFTTKEKSKGSGLGLPVVYSIVTAHDGAIEIRTAPGHGTRFLIYLPETQAVARIASPQEIEVEPGGRGRILIVDDEADLADATSILLSKAGFEAAPVYSPEEALDIFAEDPLAWDLVLTDQVMPKMKGVQLAKKLLKLRPSLPIILYTGYSDSASDEVVKAAGIKALLFKPVEGPLLIQHITAALKTRET